MISQKGGKLATRIWRHKSGLLARNPLVREGSCRKQPRCQAPAYHPRHLALLTQRKLVSPDLLPNWRVLAQAGQQLCAGRCPSGLSFRKLPVKLLLICQDLRSLLRCCPTGASLRKRGSNFVQDAVLRDCPSGSCL